MSQSLRNLIFRFLHTPPGWLASIAFRILREIRLDVAAFVRKISPIVRSREFVNFTYHLDPQSRAVLPHMVAQLSGCTLAQAQSVIIELEQDHELAAYYARAIRKSNRKWGSDETFRPGRLLLHYAIVRLTKPRCVFEAGLDKGLGAIIMNRALQRNKAEGYDARYIGVEYRADRPVFLLEGFPDRVGDVVYASWADVIKTLPAQSIDFMFYDAVTYAEHIEMLVQYHDRLSPHAMMVCAWAAPEMIAIADRTARIASIFACRPDKHWSEGNDLCVIHAPKHEQLLFQSHPSH